MTDERKNIKPEIKPPAPVPAAETTQAQPKAPKPKKAQEKA